MIKELTCAAGGDGYIARAVVEREPATNGGAPEIINHEATAKDRQTALSDLKEKACVTNAEFEEFDKRATEIVLRPEDKAHVAAAAEQENRNKPHQLRSDPTGKKTGHATPPK